MTGQPDSDGFEQAARDLLGDTRGVATTEYIVVVGVFGLVLAAAFVVRGDLMLFDYANARDLLLLGGM
jgi:hypothetical protein